MQCLICMASSGSGGGACRSRLWRAECRNDRDGALSRAGKIAPSRVNTILTIQNNDGELAQQLQRIAEQEQHPLEEVLKALVARYPGPVDTVGDAAGTSDARQRLRRKLLA